MYRATACGWALAASLIGGGCKTTRAPDNNGSAENTQRMVSFERDIKPLFADNCVNCHNRATLPGRTSLESRELALSTGQGGPVIVPGEPDASFLIKAIEAPDITDHAMPPVGHRVSPSTVDLLRRWIAEGAEWPAGRAGEIRPTAIPQE